MTDLDVHPHQRAFRIHATIYLIVSLLLIVVWAVGTAVGGTMFFWPLIPIVLWGMGVAINGYLVKTNHDTL